MCRNYAKGRDWYDFSWYVKSNCSPNLRLLENALKELGPWQGKNIKVDGEFLKAALVERIDSLNWEDIKEDVRKFLPQEKAHSLDIWGADFFKSKVNKLNLKPSL